MRTDGSRSFVLVLVCLTLAFLWVVSPLAAPLLWSVVAAIVFMPFNRRLTDQFGGRKNVAAFATVVTILVIVVLPLTIVIGALIDEAATLYATMKADGFNAMSYVTPVFHNLPDWIRTPLGRLGFGNLASLNEKLVAGVMGSFETISSQILSIGQGTLGIVAGVGVMLYVLFFLLRDGPAISDRVSRAIPLRAEDRDLLLASFTAVIRATVVGDLLVALLQGALGGVIFWFLDIHAPILWAVLMAILSLLPMIGAALIWFPVAIYLLLSGDLFGGITLLTYGALVISLVDNFLRPMLIGTATKMPDYLVLVSTLGGIEVFGLQGFIVGPVVAALFLSIWNIWIDSQHFPGIEDSGP